MSIPPPAFGPTAVQGDDDVEAFAIVRLALVLSREQLRAALAIGHAQMAGEPPLEDMSVKDVRREVEGYLGACAFIELDDETGPVNTRLDAGLIAELDAAVDRAYTLAPLPPVQGPRCGEGTVSLQTLDRGEITAPEPAWCLGHAGEPVGYRADIVHKGRDVVGEFEGVEFLRARISWGPFGVLQPEPFPVVDVEEFPPMDAGQLRELAAEAALHADRLNSLANELERLRGAEA